jgi:hypothetical protein
MNDSDVSDVDEQVEVGSTAKHSALRHRRIPQGHEQPDSR